MSQGDQDADGDDNIPFGRDAIVLNDSPGSTVALGDINIGDNIGATPEEVRQIVREVLEENELKYIQPIESSEIESKPKIEKSTASILYLFDYPKAIFVPNYARDFVWRSGQVTALLLHCVLAEKRPHIGTMLFLEKSDSYEVVDGSQRLYALSIIFSAIRDYLNVNGEYEIASNIHTRLIADYMGVGLKFNPLERHREYFSRSIQSFPSNDFSNPESESEKNIQECYAKVIEELRFIEPDIVIERVQEVIDLEAFVTIVKAEEPADLLSVFSTINSRGQRLTKEDIERARKAMNKKE